MKRLFSIFFLWLLNLSFVMAEQSSVEMAEGLYQSGKIYVVVAVLLIIFAGIILFLIRLDRRINQLEKDNHKQVK